MISVQERGHFTQKDWAFKTSTGLLSHRFNDKNNKNLLKLYKSDLLEAFTRLAQPQDLSPKVSEVDITWFTQKNLDQII